MIVTLVYIVFTLLPLALLAWSRMAFSIYFLSAGGMLGYSWIDRMYIHPNAWMEHDGGFRISFDEFFAVPFIGGTVAALVMSHVYSSFKREKKS